VRYKQDLEEPAEVAFRLVAGTVLIPPLELLNLRFEKK